MADSLTEHLRLTKPFQGYFRGKLSYLRKCSFLRAYNPLIKCAPATRAENSHPAMRDIPRDSSSYEACAMNQCYSSLDIPKARGVEQDVFSAQQAKAPYQLIILE